MAVKDVLAALPRAQARKFVPETCNLGDWAQIEPLFLKLEADAEKIKGAKGLESWVLRAGELGSALYQEGSRRYICMTCQTDDKEAEAAYLHFVVEIEPKTKPHYQKLDQLYLNSPFRAKLPQRRWMVFDRDTKKDVELYREENIALQTEDEKLSQQYQKIRGAMTVHFQGAERTLEQTAKFYEETDRTIREQAWRTVTERLLQDKEAIEDLYEKQLKLRGQVARNAGFANYRDYAFRAKGRFDYTPKECEDFHQAVEELVVPVVKRMHQRRRRLLKISKLRPWDLGVDPMNRPPLRPFEDSGKLVECTHQIFKKIDPALGQDFQVLRTQNLLDLDSRKGKAPGGYQCSLEEARLPFIFMNAVGLQRDVETLLHEGGHAFHALATRNEPLLHYRHAPMEFCEVASMSMELLANPHLEAFYGNKLEADRARRKHLEGIVGLLPWIAIIDAFQHWIYTHEGHSRAARRAFWLKLQDRFESGVVDWTGFEEQQANMWHRQGHLFGSPFYYIEYGIAQLGALQVWRNSQKDTAKAVEKYRKALALGRSRPLPDLFKTAGIRFDFSAKTVRPLTNALKKALRDLEDA